MNELTRIKRNNELRKLRGSEVKSKISVAAVGEGDDETISAVKNYLKTLTDLISSMDDENKKLFSSELEALRRVLQ